MSRQADKKYTHVERRKSRMLNASKQCRQLEAGWKADTDSLRASGQRDAGNP